MSDLTYTVEGVLAAVKYPLGASGHARVQARVSDGHGRARMVEVPVPAEALEELYRIAREVVPGRILERGDGGRVTVTVTIEGD